MIPYQIRIQPELLEEVRASATKHNEGVVNKEIRELIRIGLKNRKRGEKNKYGLIALTLILCTMLAHIAANGSAMN